MKEHQIRQMTDADLPRVLEWRNHPDIRKYMYNTSEIGLSEHRAWFDSIKKTNNSTPLIYEWRQTPVGFLNFSPTRSKTILDWGFYIAPLINQPGLGRTMGNLGIEYAFTQLNAYKICGQALSFNERSIKFHSALGFTQEGRLRQHHYDGESYQDVVQFGLLKSEWSIRNHGE